MSTVPYNKSLLSYGVTDWLRLNSLCERAIKGSEQRAVKVCCLRNYSIEPLIPYIRGRIYLDGIATQWVFGGYADSMELAFEKPRFFDNAGLVFVSFIPAYFSDSLGQLAIVSEPLESERVIQDLVENIVVLVEKLRSYYKGLIAITNLFDVAGFQRDWLSNTRDCRVSEAIVRADGKLAERLDKYSGLYFIDIRGICSSFGFDHVVNSRDRYLKLQPFRSKYVPPLSTRVAESLLPLLRPAKKCLILDCDGVMWGGILGEDGPGSLAIDPSSSEGSPFFRFQLWVKSLMNIGVMVALCSKNNHDDVESFFDGRPDLPTRFSDFLVTKINWKNKAENVEEIIRELNIGADSVVFIDDSIYECEIVKAANPDVLVIQADPFPDETVSLVSRLGLFFNPLQTVEDKIRNQSYKAEALRRRVRTQFVDIREYLNTLELTAFLYKNDVRICDRISQLTMKTNQFNLTTRRYDVDTITSFTNDPSTDVYAVDLRDRYGDYGIIAVAIVCRRGDFCDIDTLLLSCRAIGRRVETLLLRQVETDAGLTASDVHATYVKTSKNAQVERFYDDMGYTKVSITPSECNYVKKWPFSASNIDVNIRIRND